MWMSYLKEEGVLLLKSIAVCIKQMFSVVNQSKPVMIKNKNKNLHRSQSHLPDNARIPWPGGGQLALWITATACPLSVWVTVQEEPFSFCGWMDGVGMKMVIIINLISGAVGLQCSVVTIIVIVAHAPVVHKCRRGKSLLSNFHVGQEIGFQKFLWLFRHYRGSTCPWCHWSPTCTPPHNE